MQLTHFPVMLREAVEALNITKGKTIVDGTFGRGGHSREILKKLGGTGRLIVYDRDISAKQEGFEFRHKNFSEIEEGCDGILLDLGVSSPQLDEKERGFSYKFDDSPLDMRMNKNQKLTAEKVLNTYPEAELSKILRDYGEEKFHRPLARNIAADRPFKTSADLKKTIDRTIPQKLRKIDRVFQGIRIEVNDELNELKRGLENGFEKLNAGGRFVIITFHSLEDRIVKDYFKKLTTGCICDKTIPVCICANVPKAKYVGKKFIEPSESEINQNRRSRSAIMRVIERL